MLHCELHLFLMDVCKSSYGAVNLISKALELLSKMCKKGKLFSLKIVSTLEAAARANENYKKWKGTSRQRSGNTQSERNPHSKNRDGKKLNQQLGSYS